MQNKRLIELETLVDPAQAREETMLRKLLDKALAYYQDPKNLEAFEAWKKSKNMEAQKNGTGQPYI